MKYKLCDHCDILQWDNHSVFLGFLSVILINNEKESCDLWVIKYQKMKHLFVSSCIQFCIWWKIDWFSVFFIITGFISPFQYKQLISLCWAWCLWIARIPYQAIKCFNSHLKLNGKLLKLFCKTDYWQS